MNKNKLLVGTLALVLIAGLGTPAFASTLDPRFEDNFVHAEFVFEGDEGIMSLTFFDSFSRTSLPLADVDPVAECFEPRCIITLPNFVDELENKLIKVEVFHGEDRQPDTPSAICHDSTGDSEGKVTFDGPHPEIPNVWVFEFECQPNPDWEEIEFFRSTGNPQPVIVLTTSYGEPILVGGEFLSIDSTALFLVGLSQSAVWMIPTVLGIAGAGVIIRTKLQRN